MNLYDIVTDNNDHAYVVGFYNDSVFINPSISSVSAISKGYEDILIAKYSFDTPSKINEKVEEFFSYYPNPAISEVTISWKGGTIQPAEILVYNSMGSLISKYSIDETDQFSKTINTTHLSKGIYIVQLINRDGMTLKN